jgi:hypothetical protein
MPLALSITALLSHSAAMPYGCTLNSSSLRLSRSGGGSGSPSPDRAQRFLSVYDSIAQHFRPRRRRLSVPAYRHETLNPFQSWRANTIQPWPRRAGMKRRPPLYLPWDCINANKLTIPSERPCSPSCIALYITCRGIPGLLSPAFRCEQKQSDYQQTPLRMSPLYSGLYKKRMRKGKSKQKPSCKAPVPNA